MSIFSTLFALPKLRALSTIIKIPDNQLSHIWHKKDRCLIRYTHIYTHLNVTRCTICHSVNAHTGHARGYTWNVVWPHSGVRTMWSSNSWLWPSTCVTNGRVRAPRRAWMKRKEESLSCVCIFTCKCASRAWVHAYVCGRVCRARGSGI